LVSILFARRSMGELARRKDLALQTIRVSILGGISFAETVHVDARQALPLFARLKLALRSPEQREPVSEEGPFSGAAPSSSLNSRSRKMVRREIAMVS